MACPATVGVEDQSEEAALHPGGVPSILKGSLKASHTASKSSYWGLLWLPVTVV